MSVYQVNTIKAARIAGVSEGTLRTAAGRGELPAITLAIGRDRTRFWSSDVEEWAAKRRCRECDRRAVRGGLCGVHAPPPPPSPPRYLNVGASRIGFARIRQSARSAQLEYRRFVMVASEDRGVFARPVVGRPRIGLWEVALCECEETPNGWAVRPPAIGVTQHPEAHAVTEYLRPRLEANP